MRTLYISDLDGTLLGPGSKLSPRSVQLLNRAIDGGALFSVATARTPATVSALLKDVTLQLPLVVMTGSAIWDRNSNRYLHTETMDDATARRALQAARAGGLPIFLYRFADDAIQIYHSGSMSELEERFVAERIDSPYKKFHIPADGSSRMPENLDGTALLYAMQPSAKVESVFKLLKEEEGVNPVFYHDMFGPETGILEVFSSHASKSAAMLRLKDMCGADRVVAFGDNLNDLPLLRAADVAVAVGNAVDEVKAAADIVIGTNAADSVPCFILGDMARKMQ